MLIKYYLISLFFSNLWAIPVIFPIPKTFNFDKHNQLVIKVKPDQFLFSLSFEDKNLYENQNLYNESFSNIMGNLNEIF